MALIAKPYPGRDFVTARFDAAELRMRQLRGEDAQRDRFACTDPYVVHGIGLPSILDPGRTRIPVEVEHRCRRCEQCLKHRRRLWTARAIDELAAANRNWFGTLTIKPWERFQITLRAATASKRAGYGEWRDIDSEHQFGFLTKAVGPEVTKYLKRIRKASAVPLRYLLVAEAHEDGFPHFHLLIHEPAGPVTKATLENQWRLGFSHWRLVESSDARASYYVCKYLAKDARTRVRASGHYGRGRRVAAFTEHLVSATRVLTMGAGREAACQKGPLGECALHPRELTSGNEG